MNEKKKILLLGGSAQQIIAIKTAKKMGYSTVLCDFLTDNPGQYEADEFYLVSTTDKEAVLEVAAKEHIDGVLAFASDPAAPTAAFVAERLNLPGNPYRSVEILCNKDLFRKFLIDNGFSAPKANGYITIEDAINHMINFEYPIIIKPVDSSGSKGITVLHEDAGLRNALEFAFSFSRCHRIIVEEFVEKKHPYLVGGDIFVIDGEVVLWGLLNCHRDNHVNPLVPVGKSYPLQLSHSDIERIKKTLETLVAKLGICNGAMNVELVVDKNDRVWLIDIGPRSGGNMIPDLLGDIFGVDIPEMTIKVAMGEPIDKMQYVSKGCYATHNLHSNKAGIYKDVIFSEELAPYIYKKNLYKKAGDKVEYFDNAAKCLGIVFFKFPDEESMKMILDNISEYITIELQ